MRLHWTGLDGWPGERALPQDGSLTVGRESACDIVIRHARVSRRHARFEMRDGQLRVRDLGSRNGILVNGQKVTESALVAGDEVTIGPQVMTVDAGDAVRPEAAATIAPSLSPGLAALPPPVTGHAATPPDEEAYRRAATAGHTPSLNSLGLLLQQRGDGTGAEAEYRRALAAGHAAAGYNLANLLLARGDAAGAQEALQQALHLTGTATPVAGVPTGYVPPPQVTPSPVAPPTYADEMSAIAHRPHRGRYWAIAAGLVVVGMVSLLVVAHALHPGKVCTRNCPLPPPPHSPPLAFSTVYRSSRYGFSVAYDGSLKPVHETDSEIAWTLQSGQGNFNPIIFGTDSEGKSAATLVSQIAAANFSQFSLSYAIPDAELGYTPGAGAIYSGEWMPLQGQTVDARVAIVAAVRNGIAVVMECLGNQVTETGALHPDPSSLTGDSWCDTTANSISMRGQKPL